MTVDIKPSVPHGTVSAPPSKSMSHRLLIAAGLAEGDSIVRNVSFCDDVKATLDCLFSLGARYEIDGDDVRITGTSAPSVGEGCVLNCRESGSTMRFFVPIALLGGKKTTLCGSKALLSRPFGVYENICREKGLFFSESKDGITVKGPLPSGRYTVPGFMSSQFIGGLLFALPLTDGDSVIEIVPPAVSRPYTELTVDTLSSFGVSVCRTDALTIKIKGGVSYRPNDVTVEGDFSNAAFFAALDTLGGSVKITGLNQNSLQGDKIYTEHFARLSKGSPDIDICDCPDLAPVLFAVAAAKNGGTFTGTRRLVFKESDRAECMARELRKFGADVTVCTDSVIIEPKTPHRPSEVLFGHNDHRIVMALSVLATFFGGTIDGAEAVNKSCPDFFEKLALLGVDIG